MFDFKEIKKITSLFLKKNQKKIYNQKKYNNLDLENIFNELIEEVRVIESVIGDNKEKKILDIEIPVAEKLRAHIKNS